MLEWSSNEFSQEFPISKRKPPSQRPERKRDATAEAIASARESQKADKAAAPRKSDVGNHQSFAGRSGNTGTRPDLGGRSPIPSTKRPKQPGS